jgi:hypothetical protein
MTPFTKDLAFTSVGPDVYKLQDALEKLGFGDFVPTGFFGLKTKGAVIAYQQSRGIVPASGYFGPLTRNKLNTELSLTARQRLYTTAVRCLGVDASPNDVAPDEYGCAETVNAIHRLAFGFDIGGDVSTHRMFEALEYSRYFTRVEQPLPGDIIISPTGYGNGKLSSGHVGIMDFDGVIMSNNSWTGRFERNYNLTTWRERYVGIGGFPVLFYRRI